MKSRKRDPFSEIEKLSREVDRLFLQMCGATRIHRPRSAPFNPPADIYYSEEAQIVVVKLDISGMDLHDARIELQDQILLIEGVRKETEALPNRVYHQMELDGGPFRRRLLLPKEVTLDRSSVDYSNGILRIELPIRQKTDFVVPEKKEG